MKIRIETETVNGVTTKKVYSDNIETTLYAISRKLTNTRIEDASGIFSEGTIEMKNDVEAHVFTFPPEMSYQERVSLVRAYFTRNDKKTVEEFEII